MKIAIYYNLTFGGAKRVVQQHVKGLTQLGNTVDIYTIDKLKDEFDPSVYANKTYYYKFSPLQINIPMLARLVTDIDIFIRLNHLHKRIAKDIDNHKYDIALIHTDFFTQAPFILRYLKTRSVYFCLEPLRMVYEYSLRIPDQISFVKKVYEILNRIVRKHIDRLNARSATHTLAISLFDREYMIQAYDLYPEISYLGVDPAIFKKQKLAKKNQVLFVAEKSPIYGYDLALKTMAHIPKKIRPVLKILSWTKDPNERLKDEDVVKLYNESLVTLSLSKYDTFGLVTLESMACGTPVIALNVAGYRETVINNKTGFLTEFNPKEIADKIIKLLNNPVLVDSMGKDGIDSIISNWTWDKHIKVLQSLLTQYTKNKIYG